MAVSKTTKEINKDIEDNIFEIFNRNIYCIDIINLFTTQITKKKYVARVLYSRDGQRCIKDLSTFYKEKNDDVELALSRSLNQYKERKEEVIKTIDSYTLGCLVKLNKVNDFFNSNEICFYNINTKNFYFDINIYINEEKLNKWKIKNKIEDF